MSAQKKKKKKKKNINQNKSRKKNIKTKSKQNKKKNSKNVIAKVNNDELKKTDKTLKIKDFKPIKKISKLKEYDIKEIKKIYIKKEYIQKVKRILDIVLDIIILILSCLLYFTILLFKYIIRGIISIAKYITRGAILLAQYIKRNTISIVKYIKKGTILLTQYIKRGITSLSKLIIKGICKVSKKITKTIKNFKWKQYNRSSKKKIDRINAKEKKVKIKKDKDLADDEINLLRYRDFKGLRKILVFFRNRIRVIVFDMRRFKKKFKYGTLRDKLLIILMFLLIIGFSCMVAFCVYIVKHAPEADPSKLYQKNSSILYYQNDSGNWVEFARLGSENREKITYDKLPEVLVDAIVATEDSRFFQHDGIDVARFTKATLGQLLGHSDAGGGSTLTMQVSKNNFTSTKASGIKGIIRKFTDIYLAVFVLEKRYTKEEIMEFYVNYNYLGSHTHGVEQAAKTYFGKSVSDLNLVEAATIAGLFQAPYSYDPNLYPTASEKRRNTVLNLMYRHGYITEEEKDAAQAIPLKSTLIESAASKNKYQDYIDTVIEFVINQTNAMGYNKANGYATNGLDPTTVPMKIYTTLKPQKQEIVDGVISGETYKWRNDSVQAGIVVTDVKTGAIVAVGASRDPAARVFNFATAEPGQTGSAAKPVVDYGPAFEYLNWSTGQTVIDDEIEYEGGYGSVRNFDNKYNGIMTAKTALATSRNVPALLTFRQTTNDQKREFANKLNWHPEKNDTWKNEALYESTSLGGFTVSPVTASAAYATFARGGTYISPYIYEKIEFIDTGEVIETKIEKKQAMSEETAYLINNILMYAVSSGTISAGKFDGAETAAKTGTSTVGLDKAMRDKLGIKGEIIGDSWLNVYSTDYSISTWYGYREKTNPKAYLTSSEGSSERKNITKILVKGIMEPGAKFDIPSGIVTAEVELETDPLQLASPYTPKELRSIEYFKKGTVPDSVSTRFAQLSNPSNLKFTTDGSKITLTWNEAAIPDAINTEYLRNYFAESPIYQTWADKYLQRRLEYNDATFGAFGYEVYMVNSSGTVDLGFVTSPTFTTNIAVSPSTKFIVKTTYQKFKSNQSTGISVTANTTSTEDEQNKNDANNYTIQYQGESCTTASSFKSLNPKIKVISNNTDITNKAALSQTCKDEDGNTINCNSMVDGKKYNVTFTVRYNNTNRNKQITISPSCQ